MASRFPIVFFVAIGCTIAIAAPATVAPLQSPGLRDESLDYSINWPTGLSLGEAHWKARNIGSSQSPVWDLDLNFDARIPGFALINSYHAVTTGNLCMDKLTRDLQRGSVHTTESETVDHKNGTVTRKTTSNSGGESTFTVPDCARDALTFLMWTRQELLAGRIPPNGTVLLGAPYEVRLTFLGREKIKSGDRTVETDRLGCNIKGPASAFDVEVYFARDAGRTPVSIRIPLSMGTFALELAR